ncbi:hypothetical protein ACE6H2_027621 [Prunus campanulata]
MTFWSFELAEPGHECVDLSKASDWFQRDKHTPLYAGPIPVFLGNLSFLEEASISENHFNGTLPKTTGQLKMISELNLSNGIEELESLIGSTLSSDITLFEKISSSTYRVRINSFEKKVEESQSDIEDSGVVDVDLGDNGTCSSDVILGAI